MHVTGVPFDARKFIEALQKIYKHTHPPDAVKDKNVTHRSQEVVSVRTHIY